MFEITDLTTIIQVVSLAVALVSGVAALIYFVRKPRETEEEYAEDHQRSRRSQNQINETVPENPSPPRVVNENMPNLGQPLNIVPSNMVPIYVPMYVPKSALDEILRLMSTQTSRIPPQVTPPSMKFTPPAPKSKSKGLSKEQDLSEELIRRVEK